MKVMPAKTIYEIKACADIWLESSFLAHPFISPDFWKDNYPNMLEQYLPSSDTYLAKQQDTIIGFAAICQGTLAALFVLPEWWSNGAGSLLLDHVQALHERLKLTVSSKK